MFHRKQTSVDLLSVPRAVVVTANYVTGADADATGTIGPVNQRRIRRVPHVQGKSCGESSVARLTAAGGSGHSALAADRESLFGAPADADRTHERSSAARLCGFRQVRSKALSKMGFRQRATFPLT